MKIEKVILRMDKANEVVSKRFGFPPLRGNDLKVLYAVKLQPSTLSTLVRYIRHHGSKLLHNNVNDYLARLISLGLIERNHFTYSLTPLGRQYLSGIRNYLFNIRM